MTTLLALTAIFTLLLAVSRAGAHPAAQHPGGIIRAPLVHKIANLRVKTNATLKRKCRPRWPVGITPAYRIPVGMRTWVIDLWGPRLDRAIAASSACVPWYITAQIRAANHLAAHSASDPWPNCPDPGPRDNQGPGHSWWDTVACENGGQWTDSPGFYRCGLQFHPNWETVYGRLCPL